ncbi:hypothetical protein JCM6292_1205 [Bacteroides pyogenes JCM 6292]|uniref:Uncharacterized protein n=2 Tax=Bacteroides pyogenes TaxID=310300 RepID=W4PFS6_9BACE|nr:hypothetical protein JCM6292_1205 [Bacteroides pyogenes JCM 6292]GAE18656.1 hypothetical protein JCM6294_1593 [Bacteroides pyogenes DSM 20611 = JCM 6294]
MVQQGRGSKIEILPSAIIFITIKFISIPYHKYIIHSCFVITKNAGQILIDRPAEKNDSPFLFMLY